MSQSPNTIISSEALWARLKPLLDFEDSRVGKVTIVCEPRRPVVIHITLLGDRKLLDSLDLSDLNTADIVVETTP